jgi:hypothetical protein
MANSLKRIIDGMVLKPLLTSSKDLHYITHNDVVGPLYSTLQPAYWPNDIDPVLVAKNGQMYALSPIDSEVQHVQTLDIQVEIRLYHAKAPPFLPSESFCPEEYDLVLNIVVTWKNHSDSLQKLAQQVFLETQNIDNTQWSKKHRNTTIGDVIVLSAVDNAVILSANACEHIFTYASSVGTPVSIRRSANQDS